MRAFCFVNHCQINFFLTRNYPETIVVLLLISIVMTVLITFATSFVYFYPETEEFRRCQCIINYQNHLSLLKSINETCPAVFMDFDCFQHLDSAPLNCVNTSLWLLIWRLVLNGEAILNILIAIVVWRSPYLPNLLSLASCVLTVFTSYGNRKWCALVGELMIFVATYVMLIYGIYNRLKLS